MARLRPSAAPEAVRCRRREPLRGRDVGPVAPAVPSAGRGRVRFLLRVRAGGNGLLGLAGLAVQRDEGGASSSHDYPRGAQPAGSAWGVGTDAAPRPGRTVGRGVLRPRDGSRDLAGGRPHAFGRREAA